MNKENISMSDLTADDLKNSEASSPSKATNSPFRKPLASYISNVESPSKFGDSLMSPKKLSTSGRVIESLQREIDDLKSEVVKLKNSNDELKTSNDVVKKRRDALMEQLSNSKHEVDTVNSMLQRKQRRVTDLENELNEISSTSDDMKFKLKSLEVRFEKLQTQEASSTAEYERMKIAYETVVQSQKEYRDFYSREIKELKGRLSKHIEEKEAQITNNISMINKSDATIYRSIKSITLRSEELTKKYTKKEETYTNLIKVLSSKTMKNERDLETLLRISKDLFEEIAQKAHIDKRELLEKYLEDAEKEDPFAKAELLLHEDSKDTPSEEQQLALEPNVEEFESKDQPALTVAKRQDRKNKPASGETVEERIISLGKELNSVIPLTDRTTMVEPIVRPKSLKKKPSHSRRSSRQIEDKVIPRVTSSGNDSRRSSRVIEPLIVEETSIALEFPASPPESSQSITHSEKADESSQSKKKKRRRRKRKTGNKADDRDHSDDGNEGSDHENN